MTPALNSIDVIEIKREGQSAVSTAIEQAHDVIITDIVTYRSADSILSAVRKARKSVAWLIEERVDSIIKPILAGLDRLYDVRRTLIADLDAPLEIAEKDVKRKMATFQEAERRIREEEQWAIVAKERRLQIEKEEA
jgi:hypothetical protein